MSIALQVAAARAAKKRRFARTEASPEASLTARQKYLIRKSFLEFEPALDLVGQLFCLKLFRLDPSLRARFSGPVETQARKFTAAMKLGIISLGHEDGLGATLKLLGVRHRQLGIRTRHYRSMTRALIWTLEQSLQKNFTRETKDAWNALCGHCTRTMSA